MSTRNDAQHAQGLLDAFAFEMLVLAYEFEHYFPGLLDHPLLKETLEVVLPARIEAATDALSNGTGGAPLAGFLRQQVDSSREELDGALTVDEAVTVFADASDALYRWLRRYDCIEAERVLTAVVACRGGEVLLARQGGAWGLIQAAKEIGEDFEDASCRALAEHSGITVSGIEGVLARSYDYLPDSGALCLTLYMQVSCIEGAEPDCSRNGYEDLRFVPWTQLPDELDEQLLALSATGAGLL